MSILAIALLAWFLRDANFADVWTHVRSARLDLLILALVFIALTLWIRGFLFQGSPADPLTLTAATLGLALVALVAALIPARRATRVNPVIALRT